MHVHMHVHAYVHVHVTNPTPTPTFQPPTRTPTPHLPQVIQFAVHSSLKSFCDSRYCQSLCDALYRGVARGSYIDKPETAMLPK